MKNNVIISSLVASILIAWMVGLSASADDINTWNIEKVFKKWWFERWLWDFSDRGGEFKKGKGWFMKWLTDEEKTTLESMNDEEKKVFFETKKAERETERESKKVERQAHENVIDKLLAWKNLTSEEETLRSEIIEKRAERKVQREVKNAEMEEIKSIMKKKKSWEDLTDEEQVKLDEMKSNSKKWGNKGNKGWKRGNR